VVSVAFVALTVQTLPFDWPGIADMATGFQLASALLQIAWVFVLIGVALFLTRHRPVIDLARTPPRHCRPGRSSGGAFRVHQQRLIGTWASTA